VIQRRQIAASAAVATVVFVILAGARPVGLETIAAGYALALAAIALAALTSAIRGAQQRNPSRFQQELTRKAEQPGRPTELIRVSRDLMLASTSAGHAHERLRPLLRGIAEARSRHPHEALSEEAWAIVRPDAVAPAERNGPGVPLRRIRAVVDELERL
jgi:hypothetical protein